MKPQKSNQKIRSKSKNSSDQYFGQIGHMKKHTQEQNLHLEQVIGITSQSMHSIQFNSQINNYFYPTGSVVVQYNLMTNKQQRFFQSPNKRPITSICFTPDGKYLITGEGICKNPEIMFWNLVEQNQSQISQIPEYTLVGHKFGTHILLVSPNNKYLISIGDKNDNGLFVWDYREQIKLTQNKLVRPINSAVFSPNSRHLVTVGNSHLKFWDFSDDGSIIKVPVQAKKGAYIIDCSTPSLGQKFQKKEFQDCIFSSDSKYLYAITKCGLLCVIDVEKRILPKWMDLKVNRAFTMQKSNDHVIIGCSDGIIRVFKADSLSHLVTLPKIPPLKKYNILKGGPINIEKKKDDMYADCISLKYDYQRAKLYSTFSDRSIFIWDLKNIEDPKVKISFLNHSDQINNIEMLEQASSQEACFFATTSQDQTIRIWNYLDEQPSSAQVDKSINSNILRRNIYCKNLSQIIYLSEKMEHFKIRDQQQIEENQEQEQLEQAKVIKSSQDGKYMVAGDGSGSVNIYQLSNFSLVKRLDSHEQEITCIDFVPNNKKEIKLCATGSRDRLIHIYDQDNDFNPICTLGDHNSTITCLKFIYLKNYDKILLVSCSADKTIIFRDLNFFIYKQIQQQKHKGINVNQKLFTLVRREVDKNHKIFCMAASYDQDQIYIGQEKIISVFNSKNGTQNRIIETKEKDLVTKQLSFDNHKFALDSTGTYLAIYNNDKIIRIREVSSGNVIARINQGEQITGMAFSFNNKNLITTSKDGCIYFWQMSPEITSNINKKIATLGQIVKHFKNFFNEQEMLSSKEWTINSFWIEEELKINLTKKTNVSNNYLQSQKNIDPLKLMKQDNLPKWAITLQKSNNFQQIFNDNANEHHKNGDNQNNINNDSILDKTPTQILEQQNQSHLNRFDLLNSDNRQYDFMEGEKVDIDLDLSQDIDQNFEEDEATESQAYPQSHSQKNKINEDKYKEKSSLRDRNTISKIYNQQLQSQEDDKQKQQVIDEDKQENLQINEQNVLEYSIKNCQNQNEDTDFINKNLQSIFDVNKIQNQINQINLNVQNVEDKIKENKSFQNTNFDFFNSEISKPSNQYTIEANKQLDKFIQKQNQSLRIGADMLEVSMDQDTGKEQLDQKCDEDINTLQYSQTQQVKVNIEKKGEDLKQKNQNEYDVLKIDKSRLVQKDIKEILANQKELNQIQMQTLYEQSEGLNINKLSNSLTPPKQQEHIIVMQGKQNQKHQFNQQQEDEIPGSQEQPGIQFPLTNKYNSPCLDINTFSDFQISQIQTQKQGEDIRKANQKSIQEDEFNKQVISIQKKNNSINLDSIKQQNLKNSQTPPSQQKDVSNVSQITTFSEHEYENQSQQILYQNKKQKLQNSLKTIQDELNNIDNILSEPIQQKDSGLKNQLIQMVSSELAQAQKKIEQLEHKGIYIFSNTKSQFQFSQQSYLPGQLTNREQVIGSNRDLLENYSKELVQLITQQMKIKNNTD